MAKGKKTGGRDFKKGQSGNPNGRPTVPKDLRVAAKEAGNLLLCLLIRGKELTLNDIQSVLRDRNTGIYEAMVFRFFAQAIKTGDYKYISWFLDRLLGPVKAKVSVDGGEDGEPIGIQSLSDSELKARLKQLLVTTGFNKILADGEEK